MPLNISKVSYPEFANPNSDVSIDITVYSSYSTRIGIKALYNGSSKWVVSNVYHRGTKTYSTTIRTSLKDTNVTIILYDMKFSYYGVIKEVDRVSFTIRVTCPTPTADFTVEVIG